MLTRLTRPTGGFHRSAASSNCSESRCISIVCISNCYSHNLQVHFSALIENALHSSFAEYQKALCGFDHSADALQTLQKCRMFPASSASGLCCSIGARYMVTFSVPVASNVSDSPCSNGVTYTTDSNRLHACMP